MSPRSKREYLEAIHLRYKKASRKDKTIILDEFCARRLKAIIPLWLPGYARHFGDLPPKIHNLLFEHLSGNHGSAFDSGEGPVSEKGPDHHQAGDPAEKTHPDSNQPMGRIPPGIPGGRQCGPLRGIPGRPVRLYPGLR